jgi:formate C-acetyltransferase
LQQVVFEEQRYSMQEILDALATDFAGQESLRQYLLNRVAKWGNADARSDALARKLADHYCQTIHSFTNARGGSFQAALFSFTMQWTYGQLTGALPDGRKAFMPLAPGVGATPGRDINGVTGLINSVTQLDFSETPNGAVLDIALHPSAVQGENGLNALVSLIKTYFSKGGYGLQMNVMDVETLKDAQLHPEQYSSLQVRVTGYSAYFTKLSSYEQDQLIAFNTHR